MHKKGITEATLSLYLGGFPSIAVGFEDLGIILGFEESLKG